MNKKVKHVIPYTESFEKTNELTEHFKKFNCEYLGLPKFEKIGDMRFRAIRFNECGHEQDIVHSNSTRKSEYSGPICKKCQQQAKNSLFVKHGYEVIEKITKDKFLVKKSCGHISYAYVHNMKCSDKIACSQCIAERHLQACELLNITHVNNVNTVQAIYRFNCCDIHKKLYKSAVDRGNCVCPVCGNGWLNKPSKLYLFELETIDGFKFLKFGYGKDLQNRVKEYRLKDCRVVSTIYSVNMENGFLAMMEELRIHKELGERLNPDYMQKYLTRGGYTECYHYSKLNDIIAKMKQVNGGNIEH